MLVRLALRGLAPAALRSLAPALSAGAVRISRPLHTNQQLLAPLPPLPETGGKVRHGVIPEEFFQFLYPKTGVTGPYMLGTGLLLYLLSKEIYVINHETIAGICIVGIIIYGIKKYGGNAAAFADKLREVLLASNNVLPATVAGIFRGMSRLPDHGHTARKTHNSLLIPAMKTFFFERVAAATAVKDTMMSSLEKAIEDEKKEQWRVDGRHYLFDAKRNNVAMLLETNYRERLLAVYTGVKKRLDYQVAVQHLMRRKEQEHMISWVEQNVRRSITAQQEKESIAKCISDLKVLSKSAQATV